MPLSNTGQPTRARLASSETRLQWLRGQEQRNDAALCEMIMGPSVRPLGPGQRLQHPCAAAGLRVWPSLLWQDALAVPAGHQACCAVRAAKAATGSFQLSVQSVGPDACGHDGHAGSCQPARLDLLLCLPACSQRLCSAVGGSQKAGTHGAA